MCENERLKSLRKHDAAAATEQISRLTRRSVMGLRVERWTNAATIDKLVENFNHLLSRVVDIESRLLEVERKVANIITENKKWHR